MAEWRSLPATKTVLAEQALKLGEDMKKARQEEKLLAEQEKPQVVTFELPDAGGEKAAEGEEAAPAGDANVISVKGVSKATMELAIEHMYASEVDLNDDNVFDLMAAAQLLGLDGAKEICCCMLAAPTRLKPDSVCKSLIAAHSAEASSLKAACLDLLDSCISEVAGRGGYGLEELPAEIMAEVVGRDSLAVPEIDLFKIVMRWGESERARMEAKPPVSAAAADAPAAAEGEGETGPAAGAGAVKPAAPTLALALAGVIDRVRFPLIPPEALRDVVQPMLRAAGGEGGAAGGALEAQVLEGYQHHALVRIGQPTNVAPDKCRPRGGAGAEPAGGREDAELAQARATAVRTHRWLQGLPSSVERLSMAGMQLARDDAVVLADFLRRRGRGLLELDLKGNRLDCAALAHVLAGLRHCPRLEGLALGENPLRQGAGGAQAGRLLADALAHACPRLERLGLGGTGLQDDDARFIAGAAKSHAHLRQLGLSGCALTRTGVEAFAQAAGSARSALHTLVLSRNPAVAGDSPAELDALRALFPPHVALRV